ncbi:TPA: M14 family metallopeptidase [Clostridium perfringens]
MKNNKLKTILAGAISFSLLLNNFMVSVSAEEVLEGKNVVISEEIRSNNGDYDSNEILNKNEEKELLVEEEENKNIAEGIILSNNLISMTDEREIEVEVEFKNNIQVENLVWTLGGKEFEEWKIWNIEDGTYTGENYIEFLEEPVVEGNKLKATLKFNLLYGTEDASKYRREFPKLIGDYELEIKDSVSDESKKTSMKLNVYDSYKKYDELKPAVDEIFKNARKDIYLEYEVLGQSVEGRDMHFVIMAKDKASVDKYLNEIVPLMNDNPEKLQNMIKDGSLEEYKVPIFINNIHADETPGVDAQIETLKKLTTEENITYNVAIDDKNLQGGTKEETLNVDKLLEDVIILMNLTENPDGRYYNKRQNANGFDLNRDNGYQTQKETRIVVEEIAKWNPISFLELHGFVSGFLIEPCTPPHDPNYEYDLLVDKMLEQANVFGKSGIANSKYDSYLIPYEDYETGWDDGGPSYTPVFAMHHGSLGHTIEIPELNQESVNALVYGLLGLMNYIQNNKDELFLNQLEYLDRGIKGIDAKETVDKYLVNQAGESVGRPRGENENFFPEYYVLPVDDGLQKNVLEVYNMVEHLLRNGVKVGVTTEDVEINGIKYPKGSYIVDMYQAKRGLANMLLYDGYDVSDFDEMYAEIVVNFPALRGFNEYEIRQADAFKNKYTNVKDVKKPITIFEDGDEVVLENISTDTIKAINKLLENGEEVEVILNSGDDFSKGDFLVEVNDLKKLCNEYYLEVEKANEEIKSETLEKPKVANIGSAESTWILKELGFELVSVDDATIIVDDYGNATLDYLNKDKDYLGIGMWSLDAVKSSNIIPEFDYDTTDPYGYHEGLVKGIYNLDSVITSRYDEEELIYTANGAWISSVSEDAKVLGKISDEEDFFIAGWWPNNEKAKGKIMAFTEEVNGKNVTLFADNLMNKAHPQHKYRLISNTIYASTYDENKDITPPEIKIEGVEDRKTYDKPVTPIVTAEEGAKLYIELNGEEWDGKPIEKSGEYILSVEAEDGVGNKNQIKISFKINIPGNDSDDEDDDNLNDDENNGGNDDSIEDEDKEEDKNNSLPQTGVELGRESIIFLGFISTLGGCFLKFSKKREE